MSEKTLQYRIDGPDSPDTDVLVLGASLGTTWHMWDRQVPELARQWRVVRFDLPGHGGSPAYPAASVAELADRLLATLDELGIDRFGYAGCSLGAAVGLQLALTRPRRVTSLALVSASPRNGTADAWRQRGVVVRTNGLDPIARTAPERWFTPVFAGAQPAIVEWAVEMVRTTDPGCYIAACEALAAFDVRSELGQVQVPTLVVAGADDHLTPTTDARALVAGIPDAGLALVPAASHLAPVEQPAAVTDLLTRHFTTAWHDRPGTGTGTGTGTPAATVVPPRPTTSPSQPAAIESGLTPPATADAGSYERGVQVRREILGDAHVDRAEAEADDFTGDFQNLLSRLVWGETWTRPGLDRRTRSVVTLTALLARGHQEELALHTRAALRNGLTPDEIKEVLLHAAVYCGVPAANTAFRIAQRVIREETSPEE
ncbi:4-carboxymuconolactone decarboxylase [Streptomyces sp. NPDC059740]|uniref:bifunctional 3-oxoadipate enol-lactonase/4-carboxymuconolactone decarboxylase PcaDC n=1 Tax=Streptomyces sp. NPDC059740 TaxID=3346926 RepID=UPI003649AF44